MVYLIEVYREGNAIDLYFQHIIADESSYMTFLAGPL
jgi:hypothetical protein